MVTCVFEEGQIVIAQRAEDEPALCWFAVTRPSTMTVEMRRAELNSRGVGTPAYRALEQMVPGLGANIAWFPTIAEGMTLLTDVAAMISETAPEDQVAQSGLTKVRDWEGMSGLYEKPIAGGTLRLALTDTRINLVFETETTVSTPFLITTQGGPVIRRSTSRCRDSCGHRQDGSASPWHRHVSSRARRPHGNPRRGPTDRLEEGKMKLELTEDEIKQNLEKWAAKRQGLSVSART